MVRSQNKIKEIKKISRLARDTLSCYQTTSFESEKKKRIGTFYFSFFIFYPLIVAMAPRPVFLESDLEPDDLLAVYVLLKRGYSLDQVVVGEGDSRIKLERFLAYWAMLHAEFPRQVPADPAVLRGLSSKKPFPGDGQDVSDDDALLVRAAAREKDEDESTVCEAYRTRLVAYLERHEAPLVIQLKPMRELLAVWESIPHALRLKTTLAHYGSFNYRSLMDKADPVGSHARIEAMLRSGFGRVVVYESFLATGAQNSITRDSMPALYRALDAFASSSPFLDCMKRLTLAWNQHCLERCQKSVAWYDKKPQPLSDMDREARHRSLKIVDGIQKSLDSQMVLADSGLALVLENNETFSDQCVPADLSFDVATGYTQHVPRADATTSVYLGVPYNSLDACFCAIFALRE